MSNMQFAKGNYGLLSGTVYQIPLLRHVVFSWGCVPMPANERGDVVVACEAPFVSSRCANPQLAWEFIKILLSREIQEMIAVLGYGLPSLKEVEPKPSDEQEAALLNLAKLQINSLKSAWQYPDTKLFVWLGRALKDALLGEMDPDKTCRDLAREVEAIISHRNLRLEPDRLALL